MHIIFAALPGDTATYFGGQLWYGKAVNESYKCIWHIDTIILSPEQFDVIDFYTARCPEEEY